MKPHDHNNAFHADLHAPSIFRGDPAFRGTSTTGKTLSETTSAVVSAAIKATGRSPGTVKGLSGKSDLAIEEWSARTGRGA